MSAYSLDLRERVVESVKKGVPKAETARRFGVHRATVKRYCMDKLGAHRPKKIEELIEQRGCELLYLPSYSPDLNPIEEAFAKIKHILRKIGARTKEALIEAMGRALAAVGIQDAWGYFAHCGYRTPAQQL